MPTQHKFIGNQSPKFLKKILAKYQVKNIFLITDNHAYTASGAKKRFSPILAPYNTTQFSEFSANPTYEELMRGINSFNTNSFDITIAIGGGTALDLAKLITSIDTQHNDVKKIVYGKQKLTNKKTPLIAIPTTAGSGSEATHFAVIYLQQKKYSVAHPILRPDIAIIDPDLTHSCPPHLTAICGMDALSQAIESYWSIHSTPQSKKYSAQALSLILTHLVPAVRKGTKQDRFALAKAAHLAGQAINITKTTAPHALSYTLTTEYGVPHGQAVAVLLPQFIIYNSISNKNINDPRGETYVTQTINEINQLLSAQTAQESCQHLTKLMHSIGISTTLKALGVKTKQDIESLVTGVNYERLGNNPRTITANDLRKLLMIIR